MELEFPLMVYVDETFRENYLKSQNWKKKPASAVILDDNPLSIAMYMQEHPEIDFKDDLSQLGHEDMIKLNKMLEKTEQEKMSAQDIIDWVIGK